MIKIKKFLRKILKAQFFGKHKYIYIYLPLVFSILLVFVNIGNSNIEKSVVNIITIIGITGGLLLNFLAIILTDNSTILSELRNKIDDDNIYGKIDIGTKNHPNIKKINYYYLMYYKVFFLIFLSIIFIFIYIGSFLGIQNIINYIDNNFLNFDINLQNFDINLLNGLIKYGIIKFIVIFVYLYLIFVYFISLFHLIFRLYYLFHNKED